MLCLLSSWLLPCPPSVHSLVCSLLVAELAVLALSYFCRLLPRFTPVLSIRYEYSSWALHGRGKQLTSLKSTNYKHVCTAVPLYPIDPALAHETSWGAMTITSFLRSALTFHVRKRTAVLIRDHLPDDGNYSNTNRNTNRNSNLITNFNFNFNL